VRWPWRDGELVAGCSAGAYVIFHLAASVGNARSIENPIQDAEINILGTLRVLEAAKPNGVRKLVFSSSAGIFGEMNTLPIREGHPVEPDSPYGATKLGAEKLCLACSKAFGLEVVCVWYFNVYGINQRYDAYGDVIPIFVDRMLRGQTLTIFGDGEQTRDFVNARDVARANLLAGMSRGVCGAFNIGSATRVTINRLVELLRDAGGMKPAVEHGRQRKGDVRHSLADVSAARQALGFEPTVPLDAGLKEYVDWAKKEKAA